MSLIDQIFNTRELLEKPPVLLDIGASGAIHFRWKKLARYAVCVAFDPDDRQYGYIKKENDNYLKLYVFNCVVADETRTEQSFYLTRSPYCSSFLMPRTVQLQPYHFADKFVVDKEIRLSTRSLNDVLKELDINYIDWFKTDSQGMDLRIFRSLGEERIRRIRIAEFEPGLIDAYDGEDKLYEILRFMEQFPFFLSRLAIKGPARVSGEQLEEISRHPLIRKLLAASHKQTAGWGEMVYLHTFEQGIALTLRDIFLGWAIATLNEEHGLAMQIAVTGKGQYDHPLLPRLYAASKKYIRRNIWRLRFLPDIRRKFLK